MITFSLDSVLYCDWRTSMRARFSSLLPRIISYFPHPFHPAWLYMASSTNMGNDLSRKLQPAQGTTAIFFIGSISALVLFFPEKMNTAIPHWITFAHLTSLSTWFGIQFWTTFVAGLTKMKLLPRHYFGLVQSKLFPKAFAYGTGLMMIALSTFALKNPYSSWQFDEKLKASALLVNLGACVINLMYIIPKMNHFMVQEHKFEKEHGHGDEIGPITDEKLLCNSQYKELRRNFFIYHGISTSINLLGFVSSGTYLWFLSKKVTI